MSYTTIGTTHIAGGAATIDCQKQVRSWRLLRSLIELLIPTCNCLFLEQTKETQTCPHHHHHYHCPRRSWVSSTIIITGTIFGHRRGKANLCIQTSPKSTNPLLLIELAIPTTTLAREMKTGILRIALESKALSNTSTNNNSSTESNLSLLSMPVWNMYCNGRNVGFAFKRKPSKSDTEILERIESVSVGAGTIHDHEIMYLRGNFERGRGSSDCQSFHLIDPNGNIGQELSIFFLRSKSV